MSEKLIKFIEDNQDIINTMSLPLSLLAFVVGFATLVYTIKLFYMKKGIDVRCSYSLCSSIDCDDKYVSNFILENRKDKSIVIFHTYLKIGHNYYLELENFKRDPLIIKPFEVYTKRFDPILFYEVSMKRIKLDKLLDNRKVKKKILLYTTEGTYEVKANINLSNPITLFFENYATAIISPRRLNYEDKSYGINIKYLVEFVFIDGKKEILPLQENSYRYKYNRFSLNKEALIDKENLEVFFNGLLEEETFKNIKKVTVIDYKNETTKIMNQMEKTILIDAEHYNFFQYYILGKILTIIENIQMRLENYFRNNKLGKKLRKIIFCEK